ncbi:MAG: phosphatase PAP2 family protein [Chitinophagaceae bacterium]|nr:phosphatase PAP2 family protein [Chitinophagaceae bacterium]
MPDLSIKNFTSGALLSSISGVALISLSFYFGKAEFFLMLNTDLGKLADQIFVFATYLGDGSIWVPVALFVLLFRKKYTVLLLGSIIYSTLFSQITKHFFFPGVLRPTRMISDMSLIHTVPGVYLNTVYSFPSGHTTTAFTLFLLFCLLIPKKWIVPVGFLYALLVGYSRIYLAQHFPLDVGAGMFAGLISVYFSLRLQNWKDQWFNKSKQN